MATMICPRCLLSRTAAPLRKARPSSLRRNISNTPTILAAAAKTVSANAAIASSDPQRSPPRATSTGAAQPFSAPLTPAEKPSPPSDPKAGPAAKGQPAPAKQHATPAIKSCIREGTLLFGLNYFKGKEDPVALADEEYPPWLWTVLDAPKKSAMVGGAKEAEDPRLYSKSATARRAANKKLKAAQAASAAKMTQRTPVYEQTVDLAAAGAEGEAARSELQKAMRQKRKADIKTSNYLRSM